MDDSQLSPRLKALRGRELARGLDPELLRRFVLYVRRYRYPVSQTHNLTSPMGPLLNPLTDDIPTRPPYRHTLLSPLSPPAPFTHTDYTVNCDFASLPRSSVCACTGMLAVLLLHSTHRVNNHPPSNQHPPPAGHQPGDAHEP